MSVCVSIPPLLRTLTGGRRELEADGGTIYEALTDLTRRFPALALHLFDEQGAIRRNIVILHDGQMIRAKEANARRIKPGDEIVLTNALAGG